MLGPLGVLALVLGSKKKKSRYDVLLFVLVFAVASGVTLTACTLTADDIGITPTGTPMPVSATVTQTPQGLIAVVSTPSQASTIIVPAPTEMPDIGCRVDLSFGENEALKARIEEQFGIKVFDPSMFDPGEKGSQIWTSTQIQVIYNALSKINDAVGGNLESRLGGGPVLFYKFETNGTYKGVTSGVENIKFYFLNQIPHHLIYHEMGHTLNNAEGGRYVTSLRTTAVYTDYPYKTGQRVMGGTPYNRIEGQGYIADPLIDPCGKSTSAEVHSITLFPADGNTANEEWGDLFANYVAGNFNSLPEGRAKSRWVHDQLFRG